MNTQPEALRLADLLEDKYGVDGYVHDEAAAELRRLHELALEQQGKIYALEMARSMEQKTAKLKQDALLEALKGIVSMWDHHCYAHGDGQPTPLHVKARAAIKKAEGGQ